MESILTRGYPTIEELKATCGYPSDERFSRGPVAVIECIQPIPCNPCESSCKVGAIKIGNPITNLPKLNEDKCTGCSLCLSKCSGLAIFIVNKNFTDTEATITFPHEYYPLPLKGDIVDAVNRGGKELCKGRVIKVNDSPLNDKTPLVTIAVPKVLSDTVRGMKRLTKGDTYEG